MGRADKKDNRQYDLLWFFGRRLAHEVGGCALRSRWGRRGPENGGGTSLSGNSRVFGLDYRVEVVY